MYRVRLHYSYEDWAYHRRCVALRKYAPAGFEVDIGAWHPCVKTDPWPENARYDLVLQLVPDHDNLRSFLNYRGQPETLIVGGLNVGWGHHAKRLRMCSSADHIVVNNRDLWERLGRPDGMSWISNGVDLDTFRVTKDPAARTPCVLWTGCAYHCAHTNIKGWREVLLPLAVKLEAAGMWSRFRRTHADRPGDRLTTPQMVEWYNSGTIYVCASSSEGTPNPALEAAACGCVVVSTRVGNMLELIEPYRNGELVDRDVDEMFAAILRCQKRYAEMARSMQTRLLYDWGWHLRAAAYYALFKRLIDERRNEPIQDQAAV